MNILLILLSVLFISCQQKLVKNSRNVLSKDLNEYSFVINSWYANKGVITGFTNENIFLNDYLNSSSKERPPKYLVYYIEDSKMNFAYKIKITLDNSTSPVTQVVRLMGDKLGCGQRQLANEDFRRQSCYYQDEKPIIDSTSYDINLLFNKLNEQIAKEKN